MYLDGHNTSLNDYVCLLLNVRHVAVSTPFHCFALLAYLNLHTEAIFWRLFCLSWIILVDVYPVVLNMLLDVRNDYYFPSRLVSSHGLYMLTVQDIYSWYHIGRELIRD